jgi:hypothetical protein
MAEEKGWLPSLGHASLGTLAISGSRPYANHPNRFYRESAALLGSGLPPRTALGGAQRAIRSRIAERATPAIAPTGATATMITLMCESSHVPGRGRQRNIIARMATTAPIPLMNK